MNIIKRILAVFLAVLIVVSSCIVMIYAQQTEKSVDPNILMFENVLNNRKWIIESLIDGNFENNPFTNTIQHASEESMMTEVLTNYKTDKAFKYLVDTMDTVDNAGNYVGMKVEEVIAVFSYWLGLMDDESLITYVDESIKSVKDLHYESILNDILQTDYTSSWGSTLFEANSTLEQYRQMADTLSKLSDYQKALKANSDILLMESFKDSKDFTDYVDKFIDAYTDSLYDSLVTKYEDGFIADNEALVKHVANGLATVGVYMAEMMIPESRSAMEDDTVFSALFTLHFSPEINSILKGAGKVLNIGTEAIKYAQLLESLVKQNDTSIKVMQRMKSGTDDHDLSVTLDLYSELVAAQAESQALSYDVVIDYVNSKKSEWIGDKVIKGAGKLFDKYLTMRDGYFDADLQIMTNVTSQNLIKLGKCVTLGVWLADKATNIKDTAKEIYVCKYTDKILSAAINTYKNDYRKYLEDKTDENAKNCIDDLEYIKKLRLYGESHAYKSICSQTESVVGLLLGSDDVQDYIDGRYQASVDSLLGCTILPQSNIEFTVAKGETLTLYPQVLDNGYLTLIAIYEKADGTKIEFPEATSILKSWINVNGGTLILLSNKFGSSNLFIPAIKCTDTSLIELYGSSLYIGKLQNSGTLTVEFKNETAKMAVADALTNSGTIHFNGNGNTAESYITNNSGIINLNKTILDITGNLENSNVINGPVLVTSTGSNKYYNDSYSEIPVPEISGEGNISNLAFSSSYKKGIRITGEQCISESLSIGNTRLRTSENLILTGSCVADENTLKGNVTFRDYTSPSPLTIKGTVYIENDVVFNHPVTFKDSLNLTSSCKTMTVNGVVEVRGDMEYKAGEIIGSDWLKLHGDLNVTSPSANISKLDFIGVVPQNVSSSSTFNVTQLNNNNTSVGGVNFTCPVYVTGTLHSGSTSSYANGKNVVLTGDATLSGNTIRGSISSENWTLSDSTDIYGTLFASGTLTLKEGKTLNMMSFHQSDGEFTLEKNSSVYVQSDGLFLKTTLGEDASVNINGDSRFSGDVTNGGSVYIKGDCDMQGAFTGGTLTVSGDLNASGKLTPENLVFISKTAQYFTNSAETTVDTLTVDNSSSTGLSIGSLITVNNTYNNNSSKVTGGKNLVIGTSDGSIIQDETNGDITIKGTYTIPENEKVVIKGTLYLDGNANLVVSKGAVLEIRKNLVSSSSSITVDEEGLLQVDDILNVSSGTVDVNGDLLVKGDAQFSSVTLTAPGLMTFKGDLIKSSGTWTDPNILFESRVAQNLTTDNDLSINNLTFENASLSGISVSGKITVTGTFTNNSKRVAGIDNVVIKGSYIGDNNVQGNFLLDGEKTVESGDTFVVNGNLNLSSDAELIILDGGVVKVRRSLISSGATITVHKGGQLIIEDYLSSSSDSISVSGEMLVKGDCKISSSAVSGTGLITFRGDLNVSSVTWGEDGVDICFECKLPQVISGSAISINDLIIDNTCKTGIRFDADIKYSGNLDKSSSVVTGEEHLISVK